MIPYKWNSSLFLGSCWICDTTIYTIIYDNYSTKYKLLCLNGTNTTSMSFDQDEAVEYLKNHIALVYIGQISDVLDIESLQEEFKAKP